MIAKQKLWRVGSLLIILVGVIVTYQLMRMPSPKTSAPEYTIGTTIPTKANFYLNNVPENASVKVDDTQFKDGKQTIAVEYHKTVYHVPVVVKTPDIKQLTKTVDFPRIVVQGGRLDLAFQLDEKYSDDAQYSIDINKVPLGQHMVTLTLFGQSVTQKIDVVSKQELPGMTSLKHNVKGKTLDEVVKTYLTSEEIDAQAIAYVYENLHTNEKIKFNETKAMLAAETTYLPIGMMALDTTRNGNASTNDIRLLVQNLIVSPTEDTLALVVSSLGGSDKVYSKLTQYGQVPGNLQTISATSQQTTAEYLSQVINFLYKNKDNYTNFIDDLRTTDAKRFIARYLGDTPVIHKTGYVGQVINDVAIVEESIPYALTLLTRDLKGTQFAELSFLINEWHKENTKAKLDV